MRRQCRQISERPLNPMELDIVVSMYHRMCWQLMFGHTKQLCWMFLCINVTQIRTNVVHLLSSVLQPLTVVYEHDVFHGSVDIRRCFLIDRPP